MSLLFRSTLLGLAALALLTGCSAAGDPQVSYPQAVDLENVPAGQTGNSGNVEQPAPGTRGSEPALLQRISQDLGRRLGIPAGDVAVMEIVFVTWDDASLGCPAEGQSYAAGQVEGYRVRVRAAGNEYTYHTRGYNEFVLCENGRPVSYP